MFCYTIVSKNPVSGRLLTYIGKTNNLTRRLRQHNGEIKGGAKYTRRAKDWSYYLYVTGFESTSQALCFEWRMHHKRRAGINGVLKALETTINRQRWTAKCPLACTIPLVIHTIDVERVSKIKIPNFVKIEPIF